MAFAVENRRASWNGGGVFMNKFHIHGYNKVGLQKVAL